MVIHVEILVFFPVQGAQWTGPASGDVLAEWTPELVYIFQYRGEICQEFLLVDSLR